MKLYLFSLLTSGDVTRYIAEAEQRRQAWSLGALIGAIIGCIILIIIEVSKHAK